MTTYNTYQEAKIANPDSDIYESPIPPKVFTATPNNQLWFKCNPVDHCMTVEQFLKGGYRFVEGDIVTNLDGGVSNIKPKDDCKVWDYPLESVHDVDEDDNERYILRAAALEKPKRIKVEYVKVEFDSAWKAVKDFEDGKKLYTKRSHKDYIPIDNAPDVLRFLYDLHEHIETEISERDEFIKELEIIASDITSDGEWSFACIASSMYDSGKFKLVEGE